MKIGTDLTNNESQNKRIIKCHNIFTELLF